VDGAFGNGKQMNVNKVALRVSASAAFKAGPTFSSLVASTRLWHAPGACHPDDRAGHRAHLGL
jgi:hypothetical protein